jgi:hypothetical protein
MPVRPFRSRLLAFAVAGALMMTGAATAHEFDDQSTVSISRSPTGVVKKGTRVRFFGRVNAPHKFCERGRRVDLFRYGVGVVRSDVTNSEGRYSMTYRVRRTSRFSAIVRSKRGGVHPHRHMCYTASSRTVRVRTR